MYHKQGNYVISDRVLKYLGQMMEKKTRVRLIMLLLNEILLLAVFPQIIMKAVAMVIDNK